MLPGRLWSIRGSSRRRRAREDTGARFVRSRHVNRILSLDRDCGAIPEIGHLNWIVGRYCLPSVTAGACDARLPRMLNLEKHSPSVTSTSSTAVELVERGECVHDEHRAQVLHRRMLVDPAHVVRAHTVDGARHAGMPPEPGIGEPRPQVHHHVSGRW